MRDGVRVEGVGLDDVRAGGQIFGVDAANDLGAGEQQEVVVALKVMRVPGKVRAAIVGFLQLVTLDHRAHGAIQNQDALFEQGFQFGGAVGLHGNGFL